MPLLQAKKQRGGLLSANPLLAIGQGLLQAGANGDNIGLGLANGLQGYEQGLRQQEMDELQGRQYAAQEAHYGAQAERWQAEAAQAAKEQAQKEAMLGQAQQWASALPDTDPLKQYAAVDPVGTFDIYRKNATTQVTPTDDQREYAQYSKEESAAGRTPLPFVGYMERIKQAGATKVNVPINTGQKGFDNEIKLRGDFRSEPIYKAFQETQSAHQQITTALKQASPAGDLAAATKLMKILDPGSVVRESELGMAMAATGLQDRLLNYGQMLLSGQKLTPQQRIDFQALADELNSAAEGQYNAKAQEYEGLAADYGMNPTRVTGRKPKPAASNKTIARTGRTKDGRKVIEYVDGTREIQ